MGKFYAGSVSILILLFLVSCKKDQPAPSYVYIPAISVDSDYSTSGTSSSKITNVRVFNSNQLIGVYELPVTVPILGEGQNNIQCIAGIRNFGQESNMADYVFYESSSNLITLERDRTDTIYPEVKYNGTSFTEYWWEDFEGAGHSFSAGSESNAPLTITDQPDLVFEGGGSGIFEIDAEDAYSKYLTEETFVYYFGKAAYVEMDYKCNQNFFFSLILTGTSGVVQKLPIFQFNPTDVADGELQWNKIYLEIGSFLNGTQNLAGFDLCFEVPRDNDVSDPLVMMDNVKLIRRK